MQTQETSLHNIIAVVLKVEAKHFSLVAIDGEGDEYEVTFYSKKKVGDIEFTMGEKDD